ncbi:hypothetical protein EVJ58_g10872 [Rhodofomes roseus]|uniref:WD40 repeat protein n=1 Tax=Rhodofomes roseus TaxID=34475 RepID=A0A4Y9XL93_9APHY|nr:hypothetical protein EVJ58_g10872 [Rhodofomes roseus]
MPQTHPIRTADVQGPRRPHALPERLARRPAHPHPRPRTAAPRLARASLDTLSAIELEELTFRALALRRNWTSSHPRSTRSAELVPPNIPPGARPRNLAVHYLPGREGRYLLTITLYDQPAAPRKYVVHCWDIGEEAGEPKVVAALRCTDLTGATVNTDPSHPGILAITRRGPSDDVTTSIFSVDFRARNVGAAFIPLQEFASFRFPLALEGSVFAASGPDNIVRVFDVEAGYVRAALRVPREYDDPTLRNEAYESGPAQAGDHGQRIAGKVLASAGAELDRDKPSSTGEVDVAGQGGEEVGAGADSVSPGWYSEERVQTMVFHMQEEDDGWNKLAMDEDEGRIAVGTVSGQVHLFDYAPAAGL